MKNLIILGGVWLVLSGAAFGQSSVGKNLLTTEPVCSKEDIQFHFNDTVTPNYYVNTNFYTQVSGCLGGVEFDELRIYADSTTGHALHYYKSGVTVNIAGGAWNSAGDAAYSSLIVEGPCSCPGYQPYDYSIFWHNTDNATWGVSTALFEYYPVGGAF